MEILSAPAQIDNWIADQLPGTVIGRLAAAINRKKRMRQMRRIHQARLVRRPADRVNRLMFEQKQLVAGVSILPLFRDQFFLERERFSEIHAAKPAPLECLVHICFSAAIPRRAASCARRWVSPMASASAASAAGVSVKPRSARTMKAACFFPA